MSIEIEARGQELLEALGAGARLTGRYRGEEYHASIIDTKDGLRVLSGRKRYTSLSAASAAIVGHESNGRWFWTLVSASRELAA